MKIGRMWQIGSPSSSFGVPFSAKCESSPKCVDTSGSAGIIVRALLTFASLNE